MRRRPLPWFIPERPLGAVPLRSGFELEPGQRNQRPEDQGDRVRSFMVSGGACDFLAGGNNFDTVPFDGVQLAASVYVPEGLTGFVQAIRCAPFKPSFLGLPQSFDNMTKQEIVTHDVPWDVAGIGPDSNMGFWITPFGWECYATEFSEPEFVVVRPRWRWHLRFMPGRLEDVRRQANVPPFSVLDPASWFLVPNVPVPGGLPGSGVPSAYPSGFPGASPGEQWGAQRMQRLGNFAQGHVHLVVPTNTTVCLFTEWQQVPYQPIGATMEDLSDFEFGLESFFPLNPSFGMLAGYTQPQNRAVTQYSARHWFG